MIGAPYNDAEMEKMFELADLDHNGTISEDEFRWAIRVYLHFLSK